jgi:cardiolipin synthase
VNAQATRPLRWISANQVTVARIFALPFPFWALLTRPAEHIMWIAFFFGAVVGMTDFVDGWMARRDGPTTLGALLDPVADKLFVAIMLVPIVAHNECPGWAAGALFVRELLITSLRSSMAVREQNLKTSALGKLKTVVQMGGIGAFFLIVFVPGHIMPWLMLGFAVIFALLAVGWFARRRVLPLWLGATPLLLLAVFVAAKVLPGSPIEVRDDVATFVFMLMVVFTWISGFDYLTASARAFKATGGLTAPDVVRVLWSFAHGLALVPLLGALPELTIPVTITLCAELSLGGVENLVAAERRRWGRGSVLPTFLAATMVGVCAWFSLLPTAVLVAATWLMAAFSVVNLVVAFVLDKNVFLATKR